MKFITPELIKEVLDGLELNAWHLSPGHVVPSSIKAVYVHLAQYIYIQGNARRPDTRFHHKRPLRYAIEESDNYFRDAFPTVDPPAVLYTEAFIARFLIHSNHYPTLCTNFQSTVKSLGPYCAADEKLFEFVGNTPYIISKKGKLGLWQYELVSILGNGAPYLLHLKTWMANKARGESMSVATIVKEWFWVLKHCGDQRAITIGVADSYYFSAASIAAIFDEEFGANMSNS